VLRISPRRIAPRLQWAARGVRAARRSRSDAFEGSSAAPAAAIEAAVNAQWSNGWLARVTSGELPTAVGAMHERIKALHLMDDQYAGMRVERDVHGVDVLFCPNRHYRDDQEGPAHEDLAKPIGRPDDRALGWRDYVVRANAFPYVPEVDQHTVIVTQAPETQHFEPRRFADMIDYQAAAGALAPVTLHYNGIAGNTQTHWHWQSTQATLPLQRLLDGGRLGLDVLRRSANGSVAAFDDGFYAGVLVQGRKEYVVSQATELVARLDREPTRGAYNLLLLKPLDGRVRLVVIPRRADNLFPETPSGEEVQIGAMSLGGWIAVSKAALSDTCIEELKKAQRQSMVPPGELAWLQGLRDRAPLRGWFKFVA
jgi:hypothetical protein